MEEFWNSVVDILIVVIPTIVGAVGSRYIVNSWQEKKEKFKLSKEKFDLRKEIAEGYQKSQIKGFVLLAQFLRDVFYYYHSPTGVDENGKITFSTVFPDNVEQQPLRIYVDKLKKINEQKYELTYEVWKFYSTVNVYYDNKNLHKDLAILYDTTDELLFSFSLLIHSKNADEFEKNYDISNKILENVTSKQTNVAEMLAESEIRKPIE